jgi:SAM-dependent methyltransferase
VRRKRLNPPRVFDQKHYESLNSSRATIVTQLLGELKDKLNLLTAIDVGCGLGYFSGLLDSLGLEVTAVDGREENVEECRRRFPKIAFHWCSVEDPSILRLGKFDLVFCFGLLYHLENPFLAIRHLKAMTRRCVFVEGLIYPGDVPVMGLVDEGHSQDQGVRYLAFYPTEACLVKMMHRAGYPHVYRLTPLPDHPDYKDAPPLRRNRTVLAGFTSPLVSPLLEETPEPPGATNPWRPETPIAESTISRLRRFARKPLPQKLASIRRIVLGQ